MGDGPKETPKNWKKQNGMQQFVEQHLWESIEKEFKRYVRNIIIWGKVK